MDTDKQIVLSWNEMKQMMTICYNSAEYSTEDIEQLFGLLAELHITYNQMVDIANALLELGVIWRYWSVDEVFEMN